MPRECGKCAMWEAITAHGRGTSTGYCTHPAVGRVTRASDKCPFYVRAYGAGFDENVALEAFERVQTGVQPRKVDYAGGGPPVLPLEALRDRAKREQGRRRDR